MYKMKYFTILFLVIFPLAAHSDFTARQCQQFNTDNGQGTIKHCDNGVDQALYLTNGELGESDKRSIHRIIKRFQLRNTGKFQVVTENSMGGDTEYFQNLMRAVEKNCRKDCRIQTEVKGRCESACHQMHFTCVRGATTLIHPGGQVCDHAETDEEDKTCNLRDPNPPHDDVICSLEENVKVYKDRCDKFVKGLNLDIDPVKKLQAEAFIDKLARDGIFSTEKLTCLELPWATHIVPAAEPPVEDLPRDPLNLK